jgi:hypothetical protein
LDLLIEHRSLDHIHRSLNMAQTAHRTASAPRDRQRSARWTIDRHTLVVGLSASMAFGMMEMIIEAAVGQGFWSPVRYIAAVFTRGADTDPTFALVPVVVGLMGHMMNSVMFGMLFAFMTRRLRDPLGLTVTGMMYGAAIFAVMWYAVLPAIDPAMKLVNGPGFLLSHLMYGAVLGGGLALARGRAGVPGWRS